MRSTIFGVICLVLVSAVSCQYNLSPAVIKSRDVLVANHLRSQSILDKRFFKYYEHVATLATKTFAPIQATLDDFNDAWNSVGPIPQGTNFTQFNETVIAALEYPLKWGANQILAYAAMGMYYDLASPSRELSNSFSNMMQALIMIATINTWPGSTYPPKSDGCIKQIFDAAKLIYDAPVNASLEKANVATANVTAAQKQAAIEVTELKKQFATLSNEIRACNQDSACLDKLAFDYTQGDQASVINNAYMPLQNFGVAMSLISQIYPGYNPVQDMYTKINDLTNLCEPQT